ncbi:MAG: hypothetical protein WC130_11340 [Kiritimatiellia bacterium]
MMSDAQFADDMDSLQFAGHGVKWYVHKRGRFSRKEGYHSRNIAEQIARQKGAIVTPDFTE